MTQRTHTTPYPRPAATSAVQVRFVRPSDLPAPMPDVATVAMAREALDNYEGMRAFYADAGMSTPPVVPYARLVVALAARIAELEAGRK